LIDTLFDELEEHGSISPPFSGRSRCCSAATARCSKICSPRPMCIAPWIGLWWERMEHDATELLARADAMDAVNPLYIPRNHLVEAALDRRRGGGYGAVARTA
jgi:uncharacterized protein YdiU (UPF0061 family)